MQAQPIMFILASLILSGNALAQHAGHTSGSQHTGKMEHHGSAMQSSPSASKVPFDLQFLDTMSAHHQSAMEMAEMAQSRSAHDEVKGLAKMMMEDQKKDIAEMKDLKQKLYAGRGDATNIQMPGMKESMKSMQGKLTKLHASQGNAFDAMFLTMMSQHHQDGIKMANAALTRGQHDEVRHIAKKIKDAQKKEMDVMSHWKRDLQLTHK